jgi:hypothetical protein
MTEQIEPRTTQNNSSGSENKAHDARRRLLKAGVSAAPVILTLASRPVLAWHCKPPSAYASANLSGRTQVSTADEGTKTIAYWKSSGTAWPAPYNRSTTQMATVFPGAAGLMLDHLKTGSLLEQYLIAAALNIRIASGAATCLKLKDIQDMYAYGPHGAYQPPDSPGITWDSATIIAYLQSNWIVTG